MALLNSCCCWKSVRKGSFASGIYTCVFYTVILTAGSFHITTVLGQTILLIFTVLMVILAASCVVTSIILFIALCSDNRILLIPWIFSVSLMTLLDVVLSMYLIVDAGFDAVLTVLFVVDILICSLNVYCILCVISQYQEYVAGRGSCRRHVFEQVEVGGRHGDRNLYAAPPPTPTAFVLEDGVSVAHFLLPPSGSKMSTLFVGGRVTNGHLQQELSTISEDPTMHESIRKISTDCSSGRTDSSQMYSSFAERSSFSLPGPLSTSNLLQLQDAANQSGQYGTEGPIINGHRRNSSHSAHQFRRSSVKSINSDDPAICE